MFEFFRRLLEPSPTISFDPYSGRRDNRTTREKVVGGIRLAGGVVAGFLVLVLVVGGLSTLPAGAPKYGHYGLVVSWAMVGLAAVILFITANRWAAVGPGFFCVPALFRAVTVLMFGTNPSSSIPYFRLNRTRAAEILFVCVIIIVFIWRFIGNRPAPTTFLDRIALTFFALATLKQITIAYSWPPVPLISGLSALFVTWCAYLKREMETSSREFKQSRNTREG